MILINLARMPWDIPLFSSVALLVLLQGPKIDGVSQESVYVMECIRDLTPMQIYNECCVRENNCTLSKQQNRGIDCMSRMIMNNFSSSSSSSYSNSHDGGSATSTEYPHHYNSNRWYGDVAENLSDICRRQVKGMQQNCIRNELIKRCRYSMLQDRITSQPGRWKQRWNGGNNPAYDDADHYGDRRRFNPFAGGSTRDGSPGFNSRPDFSDSHNYQRSTYHGDSDEEDFGYSHSDGDSTRYK